MSKVLLLYLILALHLSGLIFGFYLSVPYYDKLLHFLGGFWVAMMTNYLIEKYSDKSFFKKHKIEKLFLLLGSVMIVSFGWELFEFLADTFIFHKQLVMQISVADTMTDLLADFVGGLTYFFTNW